MKCDVQAPSGSAGVRRLFHSLAVIACHNIHEEFADFYRPKPIAGAVSEPRSRSCPLWNPAENLIAEAGRFGYKPVLKLLPAKGFGLSPAIPPGTFDAVPPKLVLNNSRGFVQSCQALFAPPAAFAHGLRL